MLTLVIVTTLIAATAAHAAGTKHSPRYLVATQLNANLAGTPMAGTGFALEAAGWRWHVHPAFIAAIAGTESSYGRLGCQGNPRNAFGLASCGQSWRVPFFASWKQAYEFMGRFLAERWPRARTPYDYSGYAACSSCWGRATAWHMSRFGMGTDVRYGRG